MENNDVTKEKDKEIEMSNIVNEDENAKLSQTKRQEPEEIKLKVKNNGNTKEDGGRKSAYIEVNQVETDRNMADKIEQEEDKLLGKMILDVDKGFLVDEKEFDGMGNDNILDKDVFARLEEEVHLMHPVKKNSKIILTY